jgi:hypothetical protein
MRTNKQWCKNNTYRLQQCNNQLQQTLNPKLHSSFNPWKLIRKCKKLGNEISIPHMICRGLSRQHLLFIVNRKLEFQDQDHVPTIDSRFPPAINPNIQIVHHECTTWIIWSTIKSSHYTQKIQIWPSTCKLHYVKKSYLNFCKGGRHHIKHKAIVQLIWSLILLGFSNSTLNIEHLPKNFDYHMSFVACHLP